MSGSRFWTVGQCLHWIVFRTLPEDGEQITHIRLCLRYGAGLAPATMGPNEALDELQAALEEGRLSASGQRSTITRDMIGDRRQIEPTRGYVPEVFWQGARIDRDKMDSAIDATGERWTALLCPRSIVISLWPAVVPEAPPASQENADGTPFLADSRACDSEKAGSESPPDIMPPILENPSFGGGHFPPPKARGRGRPKGGPDDAALLAELRRWPLGIDLNYSEIARNVGGANATEARIASLRRRARILCNNMTEQISD